MQQHEVYPGDRVRITADQSREITGAEYAWAGETGTVDSIDYEALADNLIHGYLDRAPYAIRLDYSRDTVWVAEVEPA